MSDGSPIRPYMAVGIKPQEMSLGNIQLDSMLHVRPGADVETVGLSAPQRWFVERLGLSPLSLAELSVEGKVSLGMAHLIVSDLISREYVYQPESSIIKASSNEIPLDILESVLHGISAL